MIIEIEHPRDPRAPAEVERLRAIMDKPVNVEKTQAHYMKRESDTLRKK